MDRFQRVPIGALPHQGTVTVLTAGPGRRLPSTDQEISSCD